MTSQRNELNPAVVYAEECSLPPGAQWVPLQVQWHRLIYIVEGAGTVDIAGKLHPFHDADLIYTGPGMPNTIQSDNTRSLHMIEMYFRTEGMALRSRLWGEWGGGNPVVADRMMAERGGFHDMFTRIVYYHQRNDNISAVMTHHLLLHMFHLFEQHEINREHSAPVQIMLYRLKAQLIGHAASPFHPGWIEQWTRYNGDYVSRLFRRQFGLTPRKYFRMMRVEQAKTMLDHTNLSITDVSNRLHFNSVHYFCKIFKKYTSYSPMQYRQRRTDGDVSVPGVAARSR